MILRFEQWLIKQQYREDPIGVFARVPDIQNDVQYGGRKSDEHKIWADIVIRLAEPAHIAVFNTAWQEFLLEREAIKESMD